ncbi:MAG: CRISPR-associated endonuclease Cas2 [Thermoguttaceae bacterium]|jgi:hypothetical protein|nr:CRISPR-associated endonuclease Cas2 [Thermoguttaceae bacterium]
MPFVIAYDIADPRRLRRVARFWERHAIRCQKPLEGIARGRVLPLEPRCVIAEPAT